MAQTTEVQVPDIGGFADVSVIEVLVAEGQSIARETPLITLETEKATMDVPSPGAGRIALLMVKKGDKVAQGSVILLLEPTAAAATATATATATAPTVATGTVASTAATACAGVTGPATVTAAGAVPEVHDFMHSLLYALRSDGLGRGPDDARAILAGDAARGAGKYGSLTSSLQTLIQQVSADAPATAASSDLTASLDKLVQGLNTNATAGAGSSAMAQVSLPGLLSRLLQNVQVGGTQSVRAVGANVNANV